MRFRFIVKDDLSDRLAQSFVPVALERVEGETRLTVEIVDQAELIGLVDRMGDFGIELMAITPADLDPGS